MANTTTVTPDDISFENAGDTPPLAQDVQPSGDGGKFTRPEEGSPNPAILVDLGNVTSVTGVRVMGAGQVALYKKVRNVILLNITIPPNAIVTKLYFLKILSQYEKLHLLKTKNILEWPRVWIPTC